MKVFNHVQIKVSNLTNSKLFYDAIMNILGHDVVLFIDKTVIGYGTTVHDMFEIRLATNETPLSSAVHIAFNAPTLQSVDEFYWTAIGKGGKCNGKPGFRKEYEKGYYAAFVTDPDGHNVEAVYSVK